MHYLALIAILAISGVRYCGAEQIQMPDSIARLSDSDLETELHDLQKNVSEIWTYIYSLRNVVGQHLTHLRQHQIELEKYHTSDSHTAHDSSHDHSTGDDHHHSEGHDHSHATEQHGGAHGHDGDHDNEHHSHDHGSGHHSHDHGDHHSNDHENDHHSHDHGSESHSQSHGDDHHSHSHSEEQHSHDHSKEESGHAHDHSKEHVESSHSHSHSHGEEDSHHHDHKDSHEKEDDQQKQEPEPSMAPVVKPTERAGHSHHHHGHHNSEKPRKPTSDPLRLFPLFNIHHDILNDHRSNVTVIPKYSEYNQYGFAVCRVQPNRAIPEDQQQEVKGEVSFWQKKTGGPMGIHVRLQGFAIGGHHGDHHGGHQEQQQMNETPEAGHKHGFHLHTSGDLSNGCQSTGPHYNPEMVDHGAPRAYVRHYGDLGNIECDDAGVANIVFSDDIIAMTGQHSIIGKSLVIHADTDDYGLKPNDQESLKTGNAGTRIACCIVEPIEKLPMRSHKALKSATQYQNR